MPAPGLSSIGDAPFFLWLHLMDPHSPYYPKEAALALMGHGAITPYRARYLNSYWNRSDLGPRRLARHRDEVVGLYDAGVRWVDAQIARLIETLRGANRWDNCIFAFTADHGEEFLDHGGRYHPPSQLMEELIHVPLLLRVPGSVKRQMAKSPFSLLHLGADSAGCRGVGCPGGLPGPQLLGFAAAGRERRQRCDLGVRRGLHESFSSRESHWASRVVGQGISLQVGALL